MRPGRPGRAALLSNVHPDPSKLPNMSMARRPPAPHRGISFAIDEAADEEGILEMSRDALKIANGPTSFDEDPVVVETRRRDGHHRIGSVNSDISTTSTDYADSPSGSGDEAPDPAKGPSLLRRRTSFFTLLRRSTNKA